MKIVILDGGLANPGDLSWAGFEALGEVALYPDSRRHIAAERIGDAEVVISNKTPIDGEIMAACPNLRYIGLLATGYNHIDVRAAAQHGITVCNVPGYSTQAVAQHTFALLLEICNQVGLHSREVLGGKWQAMNEWSFCDAPLVELTSKTMGIIGFGDIGKAVGGIAAAMGMRVLATGSRPTPEGRRIAEYTDIDTLLGQSDVVSLHCPLLPETERLIDETAIGKMKPNAILLNTARGGLVDEKALTEALNSRRLFAAGVDVVSREPIRTENPLLTAKNCFITPHIAWAAFETRARLLEIVLQNLKAFLSGTLQNVVSY